jgi:hypothetical protein
MTESTMTFQDHAIEDETTSTVDSPLTYWTDRLLQPGLDSEQSHVPTYGDPQRRLALVLALEDGWAMSDAMRQICDFLKISVERINSNEDLLPFLQLCRPMAVIATMDAEGQDGCNVLMTVAQHDPSLPVLLMTGADPVAAGAADAVTELWGLTQVMQAASWPAPGTIVEFLCRAGLQGNCLSIMPV